MNDATAQTNPTSFNQQLADSLGADSYGMKMYVLVILKTGKKADVPKQTMDSLFAGHMKNIGRLSKEGKLIVAGPLRANEKTFRGIFILNVVSKEEAKTLLDTDPAVAAGVLDAEIFEWYGSAALPMYLQYHDSIAKKKM